MSAKKVWLIIIVVSPLTYSCNAQNKNGTAEDISISKKVDYYVENLKKNISEFQLVLTIDHSRLAANEGFYMPPAVVYFFSDPALNSKLLRINPLIGWDLPFKVLCYSEPGTTSVSVAFTSAEFIAARQGIPINLLDDYKDQITSILSNFPSNSLSQTNVDSFKLNFGINLIESDFDFEQTIANLKKIIMSQGDTKWFGEINYQKEASTLGINIFPSTLLLFGGPAPGGKAMSDSPKLGLDAFCQKVLVYQDVEGKVMVAFNDIVAFAELYYGRTTQPQQMINQRLKSTFTMAVSNSK